MRHRRAGRKLGRNATHRLALYRNLALALFRHERIITTVEKAKAVRPFVEKLITLARKAAINPEKALHARRLVLARLGTPSNAAVRPPQRDDEGDPTKIIVKLFTEIGPRFKERPGGYTRIVHVQNRLGDNAPMSILELVEKSEKTEPEKKPAAEKKAEEKKTAASSGDQGAGEKKPPKQKKAKKESSEKKD